MTGGVGPQSGAWNPCTSARPQRGVPTSIGTGHPSRFGRRDRHVPVTVAPGVPGSLVGVRPTLPTGARHVRSA
ncbi:hypothetical protein [Mycolicibacterium goodii]|uniref:hypothetical protein n=1 Tax=Mycolicibacterium goodii TaxID=134601 RepID=UPI001BDD22FB|nr:hypothetical protein [Mycolicibacterium goodii]MBU8840851.1 hypothetical protein [Mycolicibacterium goodii]